MVQLVLLFRLELPPGLIRLTVNLAAKRGF
jgi:hypothetical protein